MTIRDSSTVELRSLEFREGVGAYGTALDVESSTVTVLLCNFVDNSATTGARGGAIYARTGATVSALGTSFSGNTPAALDNDNGSIEIKSICPTGYDGGAEKGGLVAVYGAIQGHPNNYICTKCRAGTYSETDGDACTPCAAGYHSKKKAATTSAACEPCLEGTFSDLGSTRCNTCHSGKYSATIASASCISCQPGKYLAGEGEDRLEHDSESKCLNCDAGWHSESAASSNCTICGEGKYSNYSGSAHCTPCPSGRYGASEGLTESACTGPCAEGFACDAGSVSPSGGCPLGHWLDDEVCTNCPAGRFGNEHRLRTSKCSGPCLENWFCPEGSTNKTQEACPVHRYCASGTDEPEACPENYAKACTGEGVGSCEDGTLCLGKQCSGLRPKFNCEAGEYIFEICASLAAVKTRDVGEVGCPKDSACEKYRQIEMTLSWLSWLGKIDVVVVGLGVVFFGLGAAIKGDLDDFAKRAVLYVILPFDIILIVGVQLVAYESKIDSIVDYFLAGGCWKSFYGYVRADGLSTGLGFVKIMGFFAVTTKFITAWVLRKDIKQREGEEGKGGGAAFWLLGFSSAFSVLNYVQFILGLVTAFEEFGDGVGNSTVVEGTEAEAFVPCIEIEEEFVPVPTRSSTNCLKGEDVVLVKVTANLEKYLATILG
eukprot:CAMPEP_0118636590 /NCGR_PEP_ID=MMETSP0785-20121206/2709_1 /TAXON_ID=91992 /ORGANISM="Bolidomonas pacifica, Strain CCMP 1866" /LENGTH=657 /DNA_ID=CAMNT_0006527737 /DNA_START=414 /DNA_END=2383 /DNA_ORIENTATION=+